MAKVEIPEDYRRFKIGCGVAGGLCVDTFSPINSRVGFGCKNCKIALGSVRFTEIKRQKLKKRVLIGDNEHGESARFRKIRQ